MQTIEKKEYHFANDLGDAELTKQTIVLKAECQQKFRSFMMYLHQLYQNHRRAQIQ